MMVQAFFAVLTLGIGCGVWVSWIYISYDAEKRLRRLYERYGSMK